MAILANGAFAFYGLVILLILAPLPFGSILPWAESFLTFSVFGLLAAWAVRPGISQATGPQTAERGLGILLVLWALAVAFALFQVLPLPPGVVAVMSPALRDLYAWALPDYGQGGLWRSLSTTPGATIESGLLIGACGTAFFLVARYWRSRERILALAVTVVVVGAGEAIFGLIQVAGSLSASRPASGTFVNRNHFAALLAMAFCVGVGLLLSRWRAGAAAPVSHLHFDRWVRTIPLILACLTILAGIIFSFSRMGLTAPILMLVLFGGVWLSGPVSNRIRLVGIGVGLVGVLLMTGAWPALEVVADRFRTVEETSRVVAWEGTYALFQSSPAFGIGLGGVLDNLPRFMTMVISEPLDHSHNELLEVLAEGGVIYATLIGSGLIVYFARVVPACFRQHDPVARGLGAGCLAAIGAVLLHSLVDFHLRMPANVLYLSVIMGMGWAIIPTPSTSSEPIARKA